MEPWTKLPFDPLEWDAICNALGRVHPRQIQPNRINPFDRLASGKVLKGMTGYRQQGEDHYTCTIFGVLAQHEYNAQVADPAGDLSEEYLYKAAGGSGNYKAAIQVATAISRLESPGVCTEALWPYAGGKQGTDAELDLSAAGHQVVPNSRKQILLGSGLEIISRIKAVINKGYAITYDTKVNGIWDSSNGHVTLSGSKTTGRHCICVFGYDDTYFGANPNSGAFRFKNSVAGWNNTQGLGWLSYQYAMFNKPAAWIFQSK